MLQAIDRTLPSGQKSSRHRVGYLYGYACLSKYHRNKLLPLACQEGVAFAPGSSFYPSTRVMASVSCVFALSLSRRMALKRGSGVGEGH